MRRISSAVSVRFPSINLLVCARIIRIVAAHEQEDYLPANRSAIEAQSKMSVQGIDCLNPFGRINVVCEQLLTSPIPFTTELEKY